MKEVKKTGFRANYDKDLNYWIEFHSENYHPYMAKHIAKSSVRQYASFFTLDMRKKLLNEHSTCLRCGTGIDLTIDHIVPCSKGGKNLESNVQILCRSCNSWKGAKTIDFRKVGKDGHI